MVIFVPDKAASLSRDSMTKPVVFLEQDFEGIKHLFAHLNYIIKSVSLQFL